MKPEEILLKEYETLRNESQNSMSNRNQILSFGLAAIALIIMGSVSVFNNTEFRTADLTIPSFNLIVIIPIICALILLMWLGEFERMRRVGAFIANLEKRINELASKKLLSWETLLLQEKKHMSYPYYAVLILLLILSIFSQFMGIRLIDFKDSDLFFLISICLLFYIILLVFIGYRIFKIKRLVSTTENKVDEND